MRKSATRGIPWLAIAVAAVLVSTEALLAPIAAAQSHAALVARATPGQVVRAAARDAVQALGAGPASQPGAHHEVRSARRSGTRVFIAQVAQRARLSAMRAVTFPVHFWPFNRMAARLAHGEPFSGLTPGSGARIALQNAREGRGATTVGRLAPSLLDVWSVRGAERSLMTLVDEIAATRREEPSVEASIAFDPDSLGYRLAGEPLAVRERAAEDAMMRIARHAKDNGVAVELDATTLDAIPFTARVAERIVRHVRVPVRLAVSARYEASDRILSNWAALARESGLRLGVRMVKGSYVESEPPGVINFRRPLIDHYKRLITRALEYGDVLDVGVATHNEEVWQHTDREAQRLGSPFSIHVIRGVNPELQARMRAAGHIGREYVSYGVDAPIFGLEELIGNWRERRAIVRQLASQLD